MVGVSWSTPNHAALHVEYGWIVLRRRGDASPNHEHTGARDRAADETYPASRCVGSDCDGGIDVDRRAERAWVIVERRCDCTTRFRLLNHNLLECQCIGQPRAPWPALQERQELGRD